MTHNGPVEGVSLATAPGVPSEQEWQAELRTRRERFWGMVEGCGCDTGLVFGSPQHFVGCRYLTRFEPVLGDLFGVLAGPDQSTWIMNFHWQLAEARALSGVADWQAQFDPVPLLVEALSRVRTRRLAVVGLERLPHAVMTEVHRACPWIEITNAGAHFDRVRRLKTPLEIEVLRESARITDLAIDTARSELAVGQTEVAVAARIAHVMRSQGALPAFEGLVMVGKERAEIARMPGSRVIQAGDTIALDVGAAFQGYQTDVARTYVIGQPSAGQRRAWDAVCRARDAVVALATPGTPCNELHKAAVRILGEAGYPLRHRVGHGFGLATSFEWPSLDTETAQLEPGMTLAIEPGVYEVGVGAVKWEDDLVITDYGCEVLSRASARWIL